MFEVTMLGILVTMLCLSIVPIALAIPAIRNKLDIGPNGEYVSWDTAICTDNVY